MPVVPRFRGGQVAPAPIPGARLTAHETAESLGANVSQQEARTAAVASGVLNNAAETATGLYVRQQAERRRVEEDIRARAIHLSVVKAETELGQVELFERDRIGKLKGEAALEVPETGMAAHRKAADRIANSLTTPEAKQQFEIVRAQRGLNFQGWTHQYTAGEMQRYEQQEYQASEVNAINMAAVYADDPIDGPRRIAEEQVRAENARFAAEVSKGSSPKVIQAAMLETQTKLHTAVIGRLQSTGRMNEAVSYYQAARRANQLLPEAIEKLDEWVYKGQILKRAQTQADEIEAKVTAAGGGLAEMLEAAKASTLSDPTGELRKTTIAELEHNWTVKKGLQREGELTAYKTILDAIDAYKDQKQVPSEATLMTQFATQFKLLTTAAERDGLLRYRDSRASTRVRETDWPTFTRLYKMADDDKTGFAGYNLMAEKWRLTDEAYVRLLGMQSEVKGQLAGVSVPKGGEGTMTDADPAGKPIRITDGFGKSVTPYFDQTWTTLTGRDPGRALSATEARSSEHKQYDVRLANMRGLVAREIEATSRLKGRPLEALEIRAEVERVFGMNIKAAIPGYMTLGGVEDPARLGEPIPLYKMKSTQIPEAVRQQIIEGMRGLEEITETNILRRYFVRMSKR